MADPAPATELHVSYFRHGNWRWLKLSLLLCAAALLAYVLFRPPEGPSGNSAVGYTLGTLGAVLIVWLAWLGWRKRRYRSRLGTVRGWVSAHIHLGLSLIVIATLHSAFQFGLNIHTLAYALMLLVIATGAVGLFAYANYPDRIAGTRAKRSREQLIGEIMELNEQAIGIADRVGSDVHQAVLNSAHRVKIGGGLWRQLLGHLSRKEEALETIQRRLVDEASVRGSENLASTRMFMASQVVRNTDVDNVERLRQLMDVLSRRDELVDLVNRDIMYQARMRAWLLVHVPATVMLIAALIAHVVSVFVYW